MFPQTFTTGELSGTPRCDSRATTCGWFVREAWDRMKHDQPPATPEKFNIAPEKLPGPKRRVVFQPLFFRGYVKLQGGT